MDDLKFTFNASFKKESIKDRSMIISGELVDTSVCANNFAIDEEEFPSMVKQLPSITLRVDHSRSVRDVIGGFTEGTHDVENSRILFKAEVDDKAVQKQIEKGRLKFVSIGATAKAFCSKCNKPTRPIKTCKCVEAHEIIRAVKLREVSIITEPAYPTSEFRPVSFIASIDSALNSLKVTNGSSKEEGVLEQDNKKIGEKREMPKEKEEEEKEKVKATVINPISENTITSLTNKFETLIKRLETLETRAKKEDKAIAEATHKAEEEAKLKKEAELIKKLEDAIDKKFEEVTKKVKPKEEEEEKEKKVKKEETEKKEPVKKEPKKEETLVEGAKVEDAEGESEVEAVEQPKWFEEIRAFAEKEGILN